MADGEIGFGMTVKVDALQNGVFSTLGKQKDIKGGGWDVDEIDTSHSESPGAVRQKIPGMIEREPVSYEMLYALGGDAEATINSIRGVVRTFRMYNRAGTYYMEFPGFVKKFNNSMPTEDKMSSSVEIVMTDDGVIYAA